MKEFNYVIKDELGVHARPAGALVKLAKEIEGAVTIKKGEKTADANKLLAIMSLCIKHGDEITVAVENEEAYDTVKHFFETNL